MLSVDLGLFPLEVPKHVAYSVTGQVLFVEKAEHSSHSKFPFLAERMTDLEDHNEILIR